MEGAEGGQGPTCTLVTLSLDERLPSPWNSQQGHEVEVGLQLKFLRLFRVVVYTSGPAK